MIINANSYFFLSYSVIYPHMKGLVKFVKELKKIFPQFSNGLNSLDQK